MGTSNITMVVNLKDIFEIIPKIRQILICNDTKSLDFSKGVEYALSYMNQILINNYIIGENKK